MPLAVDEQAWKAIGFQTGASTPATPNPSIVVTRCDDSTNCAGGAVRRAPESDSRIVFAEAAMHRRLLVLIFSLSFLWSESPAQAQSFGVKLLDNVMPASGGMAGARWSCACVVYRGSVCGDPPASRDRWIECARRVARCRPEPAGRWHVYRFPDVRYHNCRSQILLGRNGIYLALRSGDV